jgi:thiosulfate/3-mercaptopyruvate sulfurtransferase
LSIVMVPVLVTAARLKELLDSARPPVVLDVRWALGMTDRREAFLEAHVPGAVYVDLETELAAPAAPGRGRHPLPDLEVLQAAARRWGLDADSAAVAYDTVGNMSAARAWWLLRWGGLRDVRLLDGGLDAWRREGFATEAGPTGPARGTVTLRPGSLPTLDAAGAAELARTGVLLDARAAERYRGEVEPIDPVAGHVPGALSAPTAANLRADGTFLDADELRARFEALGVASGTPVGAYCGSGVNAAHELAALAIAGFEGALYAGSWSEWCSDPERTVATGAVA